MQTAQHMKLGGRTELAPRPNSLIVRQLPKSAARPGRMQVVAAGKRAEEANKHVLWPGEPEDRPFLAEGNIRMKGVSAVVMDQGLYVGGRRDMCRCATQPDVARWQVQVGLLACYAAMLMQNLLIPSLWIEKLVRRAWRDMHMYGDLGAWCSESGVASWLVARANAAVSSRGLCTLQRIDAGGG